VAALGLSATSSGRAARAIVGANLGPYNPQVVWGAAAVEFALTTAGTQSTWVLLFSFAPDARQPSRRAPAGIRIEDGERKEVAHGRALGRVPRHRQCDGRPATEVSMNGHDRTLSQRAAN